MKNWMLVSTLFLNMAAAAGEGLDFTFELDLPHVRHGIYRAPYLYLTFGFDLAIVDHSDPALPRVVGRAPLTTRFAHDITLHGDYAYVATNEGLAVVDIADPSQPQQVNALALNSGTPRIQGNRLYLGPTFQSPFFRVLSLDDPTNPVLIQEIDGLNWGYTMAMTEGYAYVPMQNNAAVTIFDLTSEPVTHTVFGVSDTATNMVVADNRAYVLVQGGLETLDISDPSAPVSLDVLPLTLDSKWIQLMDDYIILGDDFQVLSRTNPDQPKLLGSDSGIAGNLSLVPVSDQIVYNIDASGINAVDLPKFLGTGPGVLPRSPVRIAPGTRALDVAHHQGVTYMANSWSLLMAEINQGVPRFLGMSLSLEGDLVEAAGDRLVVASTARIQVADVSDPERPQFLGFYLLSDTTDIEIVGDHAFISHGQELTVLDISSWPVLVGHISTEDQHLDLHIQGQTAYVAADNGGIHMVDISDPENLQLAGTFDQFDGVNSVTGGGAMLYASAGDHGLLLLDTLQPTVPVLLGRVDADDSSSHGLALSGNCVIEQVVIPGGYHHRPVDVADPLNPIIGDPVVGKGKPEISEGYLLIPDERIFAQFKGMAVPEPIPYLMWSSDFTILDLVLLVNERALEAP